MSEHETSIGTVVDRITCNYLRFAVMTNIRNVFSQAADSGFPKHWQFFVNLNTGTVAWMREDIPVVVDITPAKGSDYDTDITVSIELSPADARNYAVEDLNSLQAYIESANLDDGVSIPVEWTGDPEYDAMQYLMQARPILETLSGWDA